MTDMSDTANMTGSTVRLKGIRRAAARRMTEAWRAPMFHLTVEPDLTAVLAASREVVGATLTDYFIAAAAHALAEVPELNVHVGQEEVTYFEHANIGLAVSTDQGLMVPVIRNVETLTVEQISDFRRDVVARARTGQLRYDDMVDATFTISNLGMTSVTRFDAIINPPQAGILAIGATREQPFRAEDGAVAWLPVTTLTLTADHRAIDGATGARFLAKYAEWLASPG